MAYSTEANAGFFVTAQTFGSASKSGPIASTHQRIVDRVPIAAGGNSTPIARPIRMLDARVVFRCLSIADFDAVTATAANCTTTLLEADGSTSGSIVTGAMVPNNVDISAGHAEETFAELEYVFKGSALTFTASL